jgi:hypothetical protein
MKSFIEAIYKSPDKIIFGWKPEPGAVTYKMYVGLTSTPLTLLYQNIPNTVSNDSVNLGKVPFTALALDVQTALSITGKDFSNTALYFAITFVNAANVESSLSVSTIVEVPPVGITTRYAKDDPTINRHLFVFNNDLQKWIKSLGTSDGNMIVDDFYKTNLTTVYTYDGTNVSTMKQYLSDATTSGSYAKLTTYSYSGSLVTKVVVSDSTV